MTAAGRHRLRHRGRKHAEQREDAQEEHAGQAHDVGTFQFK